MSIRDVSSPARRLLGSLALVCAAACGAARPAAPVPRSGASAPPLVCVELGLTRADERALGLADDPPGDDHGEDARERLPSPPEAKRTLLERFRSEWSGSSVIVAGFDHASLRLRGPRPEAERACALSRRVFDQARRRAASRSAEFLASELTRLQGVADRASAALDEFERDHPRAGESPDDALTGRRLSRELETQAVLLTEVQRRLGDAAQVRASGLDPSSECRPVVCSE